MRFNRLMGSATELKKEKALDTGKYEAVEVDESMGVEEEEEEEKAEAELPAEEKDDDAIMAEVAAQESVGPVKERHGSKEGEDACAEEQPLDSTGADVALEDAKESGSDGEEVVYRSGMPSEEMTEDAIVGDADAHTGQHSPAGGDVKTDATHNKLFGNTFARRKAEPSVGVEAGVDQSSSGGSVGIPNSGISSAVPRPVEESLEEFETSRLKGSTLVDAEAEESGDAIEGGEADEDGGSGEEGGGGRTASLWPTTTRRKRRARRVTKKQLRQQKTPAEPPRRRRKRQRR